MTTIKTSDLIDLALDWAVAKCEGATDSWCDTGPFMWDGHPCLRVAGHDVDYTPSTNWSQGGPIIERENIQVGPIPDVEGWYAHKVWSDEGDYIGPTPLIAAMRCFVASKLGDTVDVPEALL